MQPANEYNIREKIKEANQELFLEIQMSDELPEEESEKPRNCANGRKVTFRPNLEEYEPEALSLSTASSASEMVIIEEEDCILDEQIVEEIADCLAEEIAQLTVCDEEDVVPSESDAVLPIVTVEVPDQPPSPCKEYEPPTAVKLKPNSTRPKSCKTPINGQLSSGKYKSCCEGRRRENSAKLPRYTGEVSEYGLSKDQLQVKSENRMRRRRCRQESAFQRYQQEAEKIRLNEEAFARWMRLKYSKLPKNKYANRYDVGAKQTGGK